MWRHSPSFHFLETFSPLPPHALFPSSLSQSNKVLAKVSPLSLPLPRSMASFAPHSFLPLPPFPFVPKASPPLSFPSESLQLLSPLGAFLKQFDTHTPLHFSIPPPPHSCRSSLPIFICVFSVSFPLLETKTKEAKELQMTTKRKRNGTERSGGGALSSDRSNASPSPSYFNFHEFSPRASSGTQVSEKRKLFKLEEIIRGIKRKMMPISRFAPLPPLFGKWLVGGSIGRRLHQKRITLGDREKGRGREGR